MVDLSVRLRQGEVQKTGDLWENEVMEIVLPLIKSHNLDMSEFTTSVALVDKTLSMLQNGRG